MRLIVIEPERLHGVGAISGRVVTKLLRGAGADVLHLSGPPVGDRQQSLFITDHSADWRGIGSADAVLMSVLHRRQIPAARRIARKVRHIAPIIAGGQAAYTPELMDDFADAIVTGEGEDVLPGIAKAIDPIGYLRDEGARIPGVQKGRVFRSASFAPAVENDNGTIWQQVAKGCRHRCPYCSIALWHGEYRERPRDELLPGRVSHYAPCYSSLSYFRDLYLSGQRLATDMRPTDLLPLLDDGIAATPGRYHLGVEGTSEATRRRLGRPLGDIDHDRILRWLDRAASVIHLYLISGVPGQTPDEIREYTRRLVAMNLRAKVEITYTALQPPPGSPSSMWGVEWRQDHYDAVKDCRAIAREAWQSDSSRMVMVSEPLSQAKWQEDMAYTGIIAEGV